MIYYNNKALDCEEEINEYVSARAELARLLKEQRRIKYEIRKQRKYVQLLKDKE